uniref:Putative secreted protein n=1 Tax=Ixodes ricinus TaxID=34613 RepID=A0A147BDX0_IXORI
MPLLLCPLLSLTKLSLRTALLCACSLFRRHFYERPPGSGFPAAQPPDLCCHFGTFSDSWVGRTVLTPVEDTVWAPLLEEPAIPPHEASGDGSCIEGSWAWVQVCQSFDIGVRGPYLSRPLAARSMSLCLAVYHVPRPLPYLLWCRVSLMCNRLVRRRATKGRRPNESR